MKLNNDEEIYIPSNFNSKELLQKEGWKEYMVERHHQKLDFILHQIYINRVCNNKYERGDYIKLSSKHHFERYIYGRDYSRLKPLLYKYNVIEDDGLYTVATEENGFNGECKGYRLKPHYDVVHRRVLVDKDTTLFNNIKRFRSADFNKQDNVTKWINFHIKDIGIQKDEAIAYVENWYANAMLFPDTVKLKKNQQNKTFEEVLNGKRERYLYAIHTIANGAGFNAIRDRKGKRVHHPLTVLWKELRQFLFLKNKPDTVIYNLDISNSQPLCLVAILKDQFIDGVVPCDVQRYIDLVSAGTFYKHMTDLLNVPKNDVPNFKIELFAKVFYPENHKGFYTNEAQAFMKEFPTVYQIIQQEKQKDYTSLSIAMQRVESKAVIDGVMTELMHRHKDSHFFSSIHDSVLCEGEMICEVKKLMEKHVGLVVGIKPFIKPDAAFNNPLLTQHTTGANLILED